MTKFTGAQCSTMTKKYKFFEKYSHRDRQNSTHRWTERQGNSSIPLSTSWSSIMQKYLKGVFCIIFDLHQITYLASIMRKGTFGHMQMCRPRPAAASPDAASALFDTRHIMSTYISCYVNSLITYRCFQHRSKADLGLHYCNVQRSLLAWHWPYCCD